MEGLCGHSHFSIYCLKNCFGQHRLLQITIQVSWKLSVPRRCSSPTICNVTEKLGCFVRRHVSTPLLDVTDAADNSQRVFLQNIPSFSVTLHIEGKLHRLGTESFHVKNLLYTDDAPYQLRM